MQNPQRQNALASKAPEKVGSQRRQAAERELQGRKTFPKHGPDRGCGILPQCQKLTAAAIFIKARRASFDVALALDDCEVLRELIRARSATE